MADWPESPVALPCAFNLGSFARSPIKTYDEFQPDYGRPLRARRYTGASWDVTGDSDMTYAQLAVLDEFFEETLGGGTDRFNMNNRMTWNVPMVVMFREPYSLVELTPKKFRVSMAFIMWDGTA